MMRKIVIIPVQSDPAALAPRKRVCAYARVSTPHEAQQSSLQSQTHYYEEKLSKRTDYLFVGIFSDSGIAGGKSERPGYMRMMNLARQGQLDLIVTKSISRFARNTLLLLNAIRELKTLGVAVEFEQEGINTLSESGEVLISILASVAEEERKQVSSNIKWSFRKRFQSGELILNADHIYGYRKTKAGLVIDQMEAEVVRRIFRRYLDGASAYRITRELNMDHMPTKVSGKAWSSQRILRLISNEKYIGDVLQQKALIDHRGVEVKNKGSLPQFYIHNNHAPIISREDFTKAQALRKRQRKPTYPWSGLLRCPLCGATLIRHISPWTIQWDCGTYLQQGRAACIGIKVPEWALLGKTFTEPVIVEEIPDAENQKSYHFTPVSKNIRKP